jgi:putative membrane protein insertion efficiency factor
MTLRAVAVAPLRFYKRFISPLVPPACRFHPTCSEYGMQAIELHGVVRGVTMTIWRILRCNPFSEGGYDPPGSRAPRETDKNG